VQPDINVLGVSIKTFGVFFALNFIAWGMLLAKRLRELGKPVDWAYEIVFAAIVGGLIGARGYYLIQNHASLSFGNVFSGSGLIWYGGLLGGTVGVLLWAWRRGFLSLSLLDMAGPGLAHVLIFSEGLDINGEALWSWRPASGDAGHGHSWPGRCWLFCCGRHRWCC